jgi:hypothetical protein
MMNCWEFKKCGREPGGKKVHELGECPTTRYEKLDGSNKGTNAGRMCWLVKATLCGSKIQGDFYSKLRNCINCDFLKTVFKEEGRDFSYGMKEWMEMSGENASDS